MFIDDEREREREKRGKGEERVRERRTIFTQETEKYSRQLVD